MSLYENTLAQIEKAAKIANFSEDVLSRMKSPEKILEVNFSYDKDDWTKEMLKWFRVQHSTLRGPAKWGIRFHLQVDIGEVKALAAWMSMKCAIMDLPLWWWKGWVIVNPKNLSETEKESLTRSFTRAIAPIIGPDKDVPAPDVYTNAQIMDWIADEYEKITWDKTKAVVTGKSLQNGWSEWRSTATAQGWVFILEEFFERKKIDRKKIRVSIQGFGNAGMNVAKILYKLWYKIVAVSDSRGWAYCANGININDLSKHKEKGKKVSDFPNQCKDGQCVHFLTNSEMLEMSTDLLILSALENQVTVDNADKIDTKYILELANGPITPDADDILYNRNIIIFPDILANAGGVTVSAYEWQQNLSNEKWTESEVFKKLKIQILESFDNIEKLSKKYSVDYRISAFILAISRLS